MRNARREKQELRKEIHVGIINYFTPEARVPRHVEQNLDYCIDSTLYAFVNRDRTEVIELSWKYAKYPVGESYFN